MNKNTTSAQSENGLIQYETRHLVKKILTEHEFKGRLLEIGAGSCWASILIKRESPSTIVIASDISKRDVRTGRRIANDLGSRADFFVACAVEKLPFRDDSFDLVFGNAVLHHLGNVKEGIQEIRRVLKTDGKYIGSGEPMGSVLFKRVWRNNFLAKAIRRDTADETLFTLGDLQRDFKFSGFDKLAVKQETESRRKASDHRLDARLTIRHLVASRVPNFITYHFLLTEIDVVAIKACAPDDPKIRKSQHNSFHHISFPRSTVNKH